jgi:hypothetical protein
MSVHYGAMMFFRKKRNDGNIVKGFNALTRSKGLQGGGGRMPGHPMTGTWSVSG